MKKTVVFLLALLLLATAALCGCVQTPEPGPEQGETVPAAENDTETETVVPQETETPDDPEAPAEDSDYYDGVTAMDKAAVEAFAADVRRAYLAGDWQTISGLIRYPITLYPQEEIGDPAAFLAYMEGKTVDPSDRAAMEEESCVDMFWNGQGICLGSGQVWLLDPNYMEDGEPRLEILALSGIVEE